MSLLAACSQRLQPIRLAGETMGTSWHVTVIPGPDSPAPDALQQGIESVLEAVNLSMSTYRQDSEISRFNALPTDEWFDISPDFYTVLSAAMAIGWQSDGAYDVTVAPLVDLWGFGPAGPVAEPPSDDAVTEVLETVGQDHLRLDGDAGRLLKRSPVSLDFSSIAKGFAVDRVAQWLSGQGLANYLVEVGGEMRLAGVSGRGDPWRIAIERPDSADRAAETAIRVSDVGVATSGDYRNFFELDGKRYSHSIDPRRGYPVAHDLVSVTVVHPSAMVADGWATALVVLGYEDAMAVAQKQGLAVYFIRRDGEAFNASHTPAFSRYLENPDPQD
ncbi:MAG: FAD:protein FMN transferase [Halieaceae bacterium]|nr:FAD:protein FMN transferase [Halieaceae bacterium]